MFVNTGFSRRVAAPTARGRVTAVPQRQGVWQALPGFANARASALRSASVVPTSLPLMGGQLRRASTDCDTKNN